MAKKDMNPKKGNTATPAAKKRRLNMIEAEHKQFKEHLDKMFGPKQGDGTTAQNHFAIFIQHFPSLGPMR